MTLRITWLTLCVWLFGACAMEEPADYYTNPMESEPDMKPAPLDPACANAPSYEELAAFNMCVACHSSARIGADRHSAPTGVNFDTEASAVQSASLAVKMVMAGAMPPNSTGLRMSDVDKQELYAWAKCNM